MREPKRKAVRPGFIPTLPGFCRIRVTGTVGPRSRAGGPGPGTQSSHPLLPEGRPSARAGGRGPGGPHAPEERPELQQVQQQHERAVAAEVAVHEEERELHERAGQQREKQRQRLPHAVAARAVGAAQVQRRRRLGHEQEHGRQHGAREFHLRASAARTGGRRASGGGCPGGAPGMPWPRLLARPALPAEGTGPARRPGRWSWAWGRPARLRWGVERGPAETRPRAPCAARALHCPLRLCGDGPQAGREPAPCDCWRRSPNGCGGPSWPRAQPLGPRALGPRSGSQPFEKRQPMGPRIRVWTSFHPSLYFVGLGNA